MTTFIENPRAPRIAVQCSVRIALRSGTFFTSCTVDVGPGGCGVLAPPAGLEPGERTFVEVEHAGAGHLLTGRIAWSSSAPPWRSGVAFDAPSLGAAAALFAQVASAHPERAGEGRAVDRILQAG